MHEHQSGSRLRWAKRALLFALARSAERVAVIILMISLVTESLLALLNTITSQSLNHLCFFTRLFNLFFPSISLLCVF